MVRSASLCNRMRSWMILSESGPRRRRRQSAPRQRPANPMTLIVNQLCGASNVSPHSEVAVQVANRNDAMHGRGPLPRRHSKNQDRRNAKAPRTEPSQMRPPFAQAQYIVRRRVDVQECRRTGVYAMSGQHVAHAISRAKDDVISPIKIMIIRHAENISMQLCLCVSEDGHACRHELTFEAGESRRVDQPLCAGRHGGRGSVIHTPRSIFASDATAQSPSLRAMHTAGPLAARSVFKSITIMPRVTRQPSRPLCTRPPCQP